MKLIYGIDGTDIVFNNEQLAKEYKSFCLSDSAIDVGLYGYNRIVAIKLFDSIDDAIADKTPCDGFVAGA